MSIYICIYVVLFPFAFCLWGEGGEGVLEFFILILHLARIRGSRPFSLTDFLGEAIDREGFCFLWFSGFGGFWRGISLYVSKVEWGEFTTGRLVV